MIRRLFNHHNIKSYYFHNNRNTRRKLTTTNAFRLNNNKIYNFNNNNTVLKHNNKNTIKQQQVRSFVAAKKKGGDHNWSHENPPSFPLLFSFFLFELHRHEKKAVFGTSLMAVDFSSPRCDAIFHLMTLFFISLTTLPPWRVQRSGSLVSCLCPLVP